MSFHMMALGGWRGRIRAWGRGPKFRIEDLLPGFGVLGNSQKSSSRMDNSDCRYSTPEVPPFPAHLRAFSIFSVAFKIFEGCCKSEDGTKVSSS